MESGEETGVLDLILGIIPDYILYGKLKQWKL